MFYAYIPLFPYMGANLGQMPAAAAIAAAAAAAARDSSRRPGYGTNVYVKSDWIQFFCHFIEVLYCVTYAKTFEFDKVLEKI